MSDKNENPGVDSEEQAVNLQEGERLSEMGEGRRMVIPKLAVLLAGLLVAGNVDADDMTQKAKTRKSATQTLSTSRPAQELVRTPELIGQAEMQRLVNCHNIISANYINPLFIKIINSEKWYEEAKQALELAIANPYELSYEYSADKTGILVKKRVPGDKNSPIPDGFEIKIITNSSGTQGCITQIIDEAVDNKSQKTYLKKMKTVRSSAVDLSWMNEKYIAKIVARNNGVINTELKTDTQATTIEDKEELPDPLKVWFMLLNVTVPRHIANVMRLRGFNEAANYTTDGLYTNFSDQESQQENSLTSYEDFVANNDNWRLELNAFGDNPGFYRISCMDTSNEIDISLDGYILDANQEGEVIPDSRGDGRRYQLDEMYYGNVPNGRPEHLLKNNYYRQRGDARREE